MRALAILCALAGAVAAQPPADAERLYTEGQQAYDAKNYPAALAAWQKSYELSKLPALVFNIAQAHRKNGDCTQAVASYKQFIALDPSSSERSDAEGFIKELEPCPAPRPVVKPIEKPPIVVTHPHPGRGKRIAAYMAGGAGVVLVGVGAVYGNQARSLGDDVKSACADGCTWDEIRAKDEDGRSAETKQWIFLGAGAAALTTAGVLYWLGARETSVVVAPHGDGASVSWTRRF